MEQLNNLDVVFLIIIGISALVGIARGMTKEIMSILGWVLAAVATFYLTPLINPLAQKYISSEILATLVSGMVVLIAFCIIWILVVDKIAAAIRQSKLSTLDRLFGFVFGAARGALIVVLVALMISTMLPDGAKEGVFAESKIFKEASLYVEPLKALVPQEWIDSIKDKTESWGFGAAKDKKQETESKKALPEDKKAPVEAGNKAPEKASDTLSAKKAKAAETMGSTLQDNLNVLQKNGEELFEKLAQPKPAGDNLSDAAVEESDLDKLLDVLEDKIVSSEDSADLLKSSDKLKNMVVDSINESVADDAGQKKR